jgi:hypothetical protein
MSGQVNVGYGGCPRVKSIIRGNEGDGDECDSPIDEGEIMSVWIREEKGGLF